MNIDFISTIAANAIVHQPLQQKTPTTCTDYYTAMLRSILLFQSTSFSANFKFTTMLNEDKIKKRMDLFTVELTLL